MTRFGEIISRKPLGLQKQHQCEMQVFFVNILIFYKFIANLQKKSCFLLIFVLSHQLDHSRGNVTRTSGTTEMAKVPKDASHP
jgi:hypothetical protein